MDFVEIGDENDWFLGGESLVEFLGDQFFDWGFQEYAEVDHLKKPFFYMEVNDIFTCGWYDYGDVVVCLPVYLFLALGSFFVEVWETDGELVDEEEGFWGISEKLEGDLWVNSSGLSILGFAFLGRWAF